MAQTKKKSVATKKPSARVAKKPVRPATAKTEAPLYTERIVAMAAAFTALCVAFAIFAIAQSGQ